MNQHSSLATLVRTSARPGLGVIALVCVAARSQAQSISFEDASARLVFVHQSWMLGGDGFGGACWFDYDEDGFVDLFLSNGLGQSNALFRNDGQGGFVDVAPAAGVAGGLGASAVVAGDVDNDGYQDLFVAADGGYLSNETAPARLYHNQGDGTFVDVTASALALSAGATLSASFADLDGDGLLDLFVSDPGPDSSPPFGPHANGLYRNNGDLTFTDVGASAGVDHPTGTCASLLFDYDQDGWVDILLAHCQPSTDHFTLFRNRGDLTFEDVTAAAGLSALGFWMGLGPADFDGDGDVDFYATNFGGTQYRSALFENQGDGTFVQLPNSAGANLTGFGWGVAFEDFNNDGHPDVYYAGALPPNSMSNAGKLIQNNGDGSFTNVSGSLPVSLAGKYASGVAAADYDNDGFQDVVVSVDQLPQQPGAPVLFHNLGGPNGWVRLTLVGTLSNRDAVGARVRVTARAATQTREVYAGSSFASMNDQRLHFGLGSLGATERIEVLWPSGLVEIFPNVAAGSGVTLVEGEGCAADDHFCASSPNSTGEPATIHSNGRCSVGENALVLVAGPVPDRAGIFFYSAGANNGGAGTPFGNGSLCIGGDGGRSHRLPVATAVGGELRHVLDLSDPPSARAQITAGSTWLFQAWFRDPAAGGSFFDLSDAIAVSFTP